MSFTRFAKSMSNWRLEDFHRDLLSRTNELPGEHSFLQSKTCSE